MATYQVLGKIWSPVSRYFDGLQTGEVDSNSIEGDRDMQRVSLRPAPRATANGIKFLLARSVLG